MNKFFKHMITSSHCSDKYSMARVMSWITFTAILVSWFYQPTIDITQLNVLLGGLLAYVFSGKYTAIKYRDRD